MRSRALIVVAVLGPALVACHSGGDGSPADPGKLTAHQYETAVNVARHEIENQDAKVTSATAILKHNAGRNAPSNTGLECTSDQVLRVRLIGDFPHTVTSGGPPGGDPNGGTVTEMDIKADAVTGDACLIGVATSKHPTPEAGATVLQLGD
jgi:hypothetical protein